MVQINNELQALHDELRDCNEAIHKHWRDSRLQTSQFETPYQSLIDGTWSKQWQLVQAPHLPKHRINHTTPDLQCTCGEGPFKSMEEWCNHANKIHPQS